MGKRRRGTEGNQESWDGLDVSGRGMSGMSWDIAFDQATSRREHLDAVVRSLYNKSGDANIPEVPVEPKIPFIATNSVGLSMAASQLFMKGIYEAKNTTPTSALQRRRLRTQVRPLSLNSSRSYKYLRRE